MLAYNAGSDRDSSPVVARTRHVTSPIWTRIDWLTSPKIRIVGLSFAELEMDRTVHLRRLRSDLLNPKFGN